MRRIRLPSTVNFRLYRYARRRNIGLKPRCGQSSGYWGKSQSDGSPDRNPLSQMVPQLNNALRKPAADERLIFIDLNTQPVMDMDGKPTWVERASTRLEQYEPNELAPGVTACVFLTNVPFHRALNDRPHIALAPSGLGIPDFNRPGFYRLSEVYRQKRKHIDAHDIAAAFIKYPQFPPTFDGSLPSEFPRWKPACHNR